MIYTVLAAPAPAAAAGHNTERKRTVYNCEKHDVMSCHPSNVVSSGYVNMYVNRKKSEIFSRSRSHHRPSHVIIVVSVALYCTAEEWIRQS